MSFTKVCIAFWTNLEIFLILDIKSYPVQDFILKNETLCLRVSFFYAVAFEL